MNNILGKNKEDYRIELEKKRIIAIITAIAMLILNIVFTALRTDSNHTVMLICNILTDIAGGWFLVCFFSEVYIPRARKLRLYSKFNEEKRGKVEEISDKTERFMTFDCKRVKINGHSYFLICDTILNIKVGETLTFRVADNIIVEVASDE